MNLLSRASLAAVWPTQVVLLVFAVWLNRDEINPDAISYIRIAQYYLFRQSDLMISGYWSPMLSWFIVPWLLVFDDPLLAAHAAMAVSAVVFLLGCFYILQAVGLPGTALIISTWLIAVLGVAWSVFQIAPDLLMAGILCFGTSRLLSDQWVVNRRTAFGAGLILGASYLAKAVALPVSALIIIGIAGTHVIGSLSRPREALRAVAITVAGFLIVAGPWIAILSYKYGRPVFSTSAPINYAIVGPPDMDRYHPTFRTFHKPETGRITSWEDPTGLPYKYWSPFQNISYAVHQEKLIYRNAYLILQNLKTFDWLGLGLVSTILGYLLGTPWRKSLQEERWRWSVIPVASLSVVYLSVYAYEARYYVAALPFLIAASFGFSLSLSGYTNKNNQVKHAMVLALVTLSFFMANEEFIRKAFDPSVSANRDYLAAKILADKLRGSNLVGPIASVGSNHRVGLYSAYLLNVPWFGQRKEVHDTGEILSSGATLVILSRGSATAKQLLEDPRFTSAEKPLFGCGKEISKLMFEVYLTRSRTPYDTC